MSDDEEMPPAVCEVCEPHALAVMYVDVEPPIGSSVPHDAMYVCAPCLLRVREVVGQCGHAFSKPDDEPPDTVHVVYLEIDGAELESWAVCPTHAKRISELKRIPTPPTVHTSQMHELTGRLAQLASDRTYAADEVLRQPLTFTRTSDDRIVIIDHEIENVALALVHLTRAARGQQ